MLTLLTAFALVRSQGSAVGPGATAKLANGHTVRILRVCDDRKRAAWSPRGSAIPYRIPQIVSNMTEALGGKNDIQPNPENILEIVAEIKRSKGAGSPSVAFRIGGSIHPAWTYLDPEPRSNPESWTASTSMPFRSGSTTVSVGVAEGKWDSIGTYRYRRGTLRRVGGVSFHPEIVAAKPVQGSKGNRDYDIVAKVQLPAWVAQSAYRVVAYDDRGQALSSRGWMYAKNSRLPTSYWFTGSRQTLARLDLQTRRYHWATFRDVRLKPNP